MRKLLVASQKGGVGKTTTSINLAAAAAMAGARALLLDADPLSSISLSLNLAEHSRRQTLREAGLDLPGVLVSDVIPGLDVISPYQDGGCLDEDLDDVLRLVETPGIAEHYGCLVVDTPPFMGANPAQLLGICDEYVLVMRAEPLAYRTLPAFLELLQRSKREGGPPVMKGIILTLAEGETPGGRWERELRGRFGTRIFPQVIPHDEEFSKARLFGQIAAHISPDATAARRYHALVGTLGLEKEKPAGTAAAPAALALLKTAASLMPGGLEARKAARRPVAPAAAAVPTAPVLPEPPAPEPVRTPVRHKEPEGLVPVSLPELPVFAETPPVAPSARRPAVPLPPPAAPPAAPAPAPAGPPAAGPPAYLWIGLAAALGIGLRFVPLPTSALPLAVGLAVAAGTVLLLRVSLVKPDATRRSAPGNHSGRTQPVPPKKPLAKKDPGSRLVAVTRKPAGPQRRDLRRN